MTIPSDMDEGSFYLKKKINSFQVLVEGPILLKFFLRCYSIHFEKFGLLIDRRTSHPPEGGRDRGSERFIIDELMAG